MKAKNESEFLALKLRYETITIEEIEREWKEDAWENDYLMMHLTGFGSTQTCSLCSPLINVIEPDCYFCVYACANNSRCNYDSNKATYRALYNSQSPSELLTACRNRAIHMGKVWEKYVKQV